MDYSFQLYSARNFQPWDDVLEQVASAGYTQVEGFAAIYGEPAEFRAALDRNGLTMPSGHFSIDMLEDDLDGVRRIADALGIRFIYCPHLAADRRPPNEAGWQGFARRLANVGERLVASGYAFGWHNHDFEFHALEDGSLPMESILDAAPDIGWQADIAWIVRGGGDPFDWIERYGERITSVHVKDIAPEGECADEDGWADVGHGTMPWPRIIQALQAKASGQIFIMEHDNPSDVARFAQRSIEAARRF